MIIHAVLDNEMSDYVLIGNVDKIVFGKTLTKPASYFKTLSDNVYVDDLYGLADSTSVTCKSFHYTKTNGEIFTFWTNKPVYIMNDNGKTVDSFA